MKTNKQYRGGMSADDSTETRIFYFSSRTSRKRLPVLVSNDTVFVGLPKKGKGLMTMFFVAGWARCLSDIIECDGKVFFKLAAWRDYAEDNWVMKEIEESLRKDGFISAQSDNTSPFVGEKRKAHRITYQCTQMRARSLPMKSL